MKPEEKGTPAGRPPLVEDDRPDALLETLAPLVCKRGVGLGGLAPAERDRALAVAAACLRLGEQLTEAQVNARLKASLAAEAAFLATDHVELRRWLVDTGWWRRDGYGHCYQAVEVAALRPEVQPLARAVHSTDLAAWAAARREAVAAQRAQRRQAWATKEAFEIEATVKPREHASALEQVPDGTSAATRRR